MDKPSVLIIDDEPKLLSSLSLILGEEFNVLTALNGRDGLEVFTSNPVSAILLDLDMPVMNGLEALEKIRESSDDVNVIIMTGKSSHEWAIQCADLNIQGYIQKPCAPADIVDRMKKLVGIEDFRVLKDYWKEGYERKVVSISPAIKRALVYIDKNIQGDITREDVATYLDLSPDYICRLLRNECGLTINTYIIRAKVLRGRENLTANPNMKIGNLAESVGFSDANYFSRLFKKHTGITPQEFKRNILTSINSKEY